MTSKSIAIETGLSDYHKIRLPVLKTYIKNHDNLTFREELISKLKGLLPNKDIFKDSCSQM